MMRVKRKNKDPKNTDMPRLRTCTCGYNSNHCGNFNKHLRRCSAGEQRYANDTHVRITELESIVDTLQRENESLRQRLKESESRPQTVNYTTITNNITFVSPFGHERVDHISDSDMRNLLQNPLTSVSKYIQLKHFDRAENRNVRMRNKRANTVEVVRETSTGKRWMHEDKKEIVEQLYDAGRLDLWGIADEQQNRAWCQFDESVMDSQDGNRKRDMYTDQLRMVERTLMNNA